MNGVDRSEAGQSREAKWGHPMTDLELARSLALRGFRTRKTTSELMKMMNRGSKYLQYFILSILFYSPFLTLKRLQLGSPLSWASGPSEWVYLGQRRIGLLIINNDAFFRGKGTSWKKTTTTFFLLQLQKLWRADSISSDFVGNQLCLALPSFHFISFGPRHLRIAAFQSSPDDR